MCIFHWDLYFHFTGNVGRTFDYYNTEKELGFSINKDPFNVTIGDSPETAPTVEKHELPFDFHPNEFDEGRWFYDTPGVIHDQQVSISLARFFQKEE